MVALVLSVAAACGPSAAHALVYRANPTEARVVDAQTGAPIEGALVIANWQLVGGFEGSYPKGQLELQETVTDAAGSFRLQGWGPRIRFSGQASWRWPQILIFKPGYRFARLTNQTPIGRENTSNSDWNGKPIALKSLADATAYVEEYGNLNREVDAIARAGGDECAWQKLPLTLEILAAEDARLRAAGKRAYSSFAQTIAGGASYFANKGCPVPPAIRERKLP